MKYVSTRDHSNVVTASQAILQGLAQDGGLFVPQDFPQYQLDWDSLKDYSYQELAYFILKPYLSDFTDQQIQDCIQAAYDQKFDTDVIAPLQKVGDNYHLELFHGPTLAFKDMALSILPYLIKTASIIQDIDRDIIILTATSGDTGKAAMEGFADVEGTKIIVFYPKGGVSSIQEKQMLTQKGDNTYVLSIVGNFDDAQTEVKRLFNHPQLTADLATHGAQFSSANSMNIGRLLPQIVYYFYAYCQLIKSKDIEAGESFNVSVPTGNFGNILAAYYAKQSGLPIDILVCASNENKVLYDFFQSFEYDKNREFFLTSSPSMDILVSSNFERLVYHALGEDDQRLKHLMEELEEKGKYQIDSQDQAAFNDFIGQYTSQEETSAEIRQVYEATSYLMDPHTAVASQALKKASTEGLSDRPAVIVSTASPFKFPEAVLQAIGQETRDLTDKAILQAVEKAAGVEMPAAMAEILSSPIRHQTTIEVDQMYQQVLDIVSQD